MKTWKQAFFISSFCFISACAYAAAVLDGGGLLYGHHAGFMLEAPKNWVFDNESGIDLGLHCVMYPKGGSWAKSPIVIYANIGDAGDETLEQFVAGDIADMKKKGNKLTYKMYKKSVVNREYPFITVDFSGVNHGYERVVYVYAKKAVCMVVLSSEDKALIEKNKNTVYEVIRKIFYMHVDDQTGATQ